MPARILAFCPGEYYHLYNRGNNRQPIFYERKNYLFFKYRLQQHLASEASFIAYCLMPTHYHLLVRLKSDDLSHRMQLFSISYTKAMNTQYYRVGALFQGAFKAKHIEKNNYLLRLSIYLHLNPVLSKLVKDPADWEFSSYRNYLGLRSENLVEPDVVLSQFGSTKDYQEFVEKEKDRALEGIQDLLFD